MAARPPEDSVEMKELPSEGTTKLLDKIEGIALKHPENKWLRKNSPSQVLRRDILGLCENAGEDAFLSVMEAIEDFIIAKNNSYRRKDESYKKAGPFYSKVVPFFFDALAKSGYEVKDPAVFTIPHPDMAANIMSPVIPLLQKGASDGAYKKALGMFQGIAIANPALAETIENVLLPFMEGDLPHSLIYMKLKKLANMNVYANTATALGVIAIARPESAQDIANKLIEFWGKRVSLIENNQSLMGDVKFFADDSVIKALQGLAIQYPGLMPDIVKALISSCQQEVLFPISIQALKEISIAHPDSLKYIVEVGVTSDNKVVRNGIIQAFDRSAILECLISIQGKLHTNSYLQGFKTLLESEPELVKSNLEKFKNINALQVIAKANVELAPTIVDTLTSLVENDATESIRKSAIKALQVIAKANAELAPTIVDTLISFLKDDDANVRKDVIYMLENIAKANAELAPTMVDTLISFLKDDDANVRKDVIYMLENIANANAELTPTIVERLFPLLKDGDADSRKRAIRILGRIAKANIELAPTIVDTLTSLVENDATESIRKSAIEALESIAKANTDLAPTIVERLFPLLKDGDADVCKSVIRTLGAIAKANAELAENIVEHLTPLLESNIAKNIRMEVIDALGVIGEGNAELAPTIVDTLIALLENGDANVRRNVINALGVIGEGNAELAPTIVQSLIALLRMDITKNVLTKVIDKLQMIAKANAELAPTIVDTLIALLENGDANVRGNVIDTLQAIAIAKSQNGLNKWKKIIANPEWAKNIVERLTPLLESNIAKNIRMEVIDALGVIGEGNAELAPTIVESLFPLLGDGDTDVRKKVIDALQPIVVACPKLRLDIVMNLIPLLEDAAADVRMKVIEAFLTKLKSGLSKGPGSWHPPTANLDSTRAILDSLISLLKSSDVDVRRDAVNGLKAIATIRPELGGIILENLTLSLQDAAAENVHAEVISVLGVIAKASYRLQHPIADSLFPFLASDNAENVRVEAINALGAIANVYRKMGGLGGLTETIVESLTPLLEDGIPNGVRDAAGKALEAIFEVCPELAPQQKGSSLKN